MSAIMLVDSHLVISNISHFILILLGQGLVSMNHILPKEYLETLKVLQDKCLLRHSQELEQIFKEEFGETHHKLFQSFQEEPIAAASLAQVIVNPLIQWD